MNFKLNALVAAVAMAVSIAANAKIDSGQLSGGGDAGGNGSVVFVAYDPTNNVQLTVDLGLNYSDFFWNSSSSLLSPGAGVIWDFSQSTRSTNGSTDSGQFAWSAAFAEFASVSTSSTLQWAVIGTDGVNGQTLPGRGWLATGLPSQEALIGLTSSSVMGNAVGNFNNFAAATNNLGNHLTVENGASVATSSNGVAWFGNLMRTNYGGQQPWSYLMADGAESRFTNVNQVVANPDTYTIGTPTVKDGISPLPATFVFNFEEGTLTWAVSPVPEPGTYALLLAGLGVIGFVARRRRA